MRITYSNTTIASETLALGRVPFGLRLNASPVVDVAQFFRADFTTLYGRGDGPEEVGLQVWRFFTTEAEALSFMATHRAALPVQGDLVVVPDDESIALVMADAVRAVRFVVRQGVAVLVEYTFTGARFISDDVPDAPADTDTVKAINQALTQGTVEQAIAYDVAFASAPRGIVLTLSAPDGGTMFGFQIRESTRTAAGFTVDFDAAVPATGYKLTGVAFL